MLEMCKFILYILCGLLVSCGYQSGPQGLSARYSTISVPYIKGDVDGSFTAAVIKSVTDSGAFEYRPCNGALVLNIKEVEVEEDNIGFRYYRRKSGKLTNDTVPTEARITSTVEVSLVDAASGCVVLGPDYISTSVDYDHDYYLSRNGVNIFSLGQLTDLEEAYDAVQKPLHEAAAEKITDYITQSW